MASPASLRHLARGRTRRGQRESLGLARVAPGPGASQAEEAHIRGCQGALGLDTEAVFTGWSSAVRSRRTGRGAGDGAAMHGFGRVARITDGEQPTLLLEGDGGGARPFPAGLAPVGAPSVGTLGDEHSPLRVGELDGAGLATEDRSQAYQHEESLKGSPTPPSDALHLAPGFPEKFNSHRRERSSAMAILASMVRQPAPMSSTPSPN